jgi:acyl carrier protein
MSAEIENALSTYIKKHIMKRPNAQFGENDPLLSSGLIDSFRLVDLALFVEDQFGVRIEDAELNSTTFDTLAQLAALIRGRQG